MTWLPDAQSFGEQSIHDIHCYILDNAGGGCYLTGPLPSCSNQSDDGAVMSDVPIWIQTLQALATPVIGIGVGVVGFLQWRTAHQKVVLDLFEKRLAVYNLVRTSVARIITSGKVTNDSDFPMLEAINASTFLFGEDISVYLRGLWVAMCKLRALDDQIDRGGSDETLGDKRTLLFLKVNDFYPSAPTIFGRYMRMDQQIVGTPAEWIKTRKSVRLSYLDKR
jgi:hypothetical protein